MVTLYPYTGNIKVNAAANTRYSEKSWSTKLAEWGAKKNRCRVVADAAVATEKRKLEEGKDTEVFHEGTRVTKETRESYKRRKTGEGSYRAGKILHTQSLVPGLTITATSLVVTLNTEPSINSDGHVLKVTD